MAVAITNGGGTQRPPRPQRCSSGGGPKFKLIHEGDIQVCRLNHSRTLISKVLSSKFLRRWEAHHVYLGDFQMYSATVSEEVIIATSLCTSNRQFAARAADNRASAIFLS